MNSRRWKIVLPAVLMLVAVCFLAMVPGARGAETLNPGLEAMLNVSNTGEPWTDEWHVIDTVVDFPGGGRAGFYRRPEKKGDANPRTGRKGILYLYSEGSYRPARILGKDMVLPKESPCLVLGVAANRNPLGDFKMIVRVDGRQLFKDVVITGSEGWQDLMFDLRRFAGQRVDIVIEASRANRSNSYAFIDYIGIESDPDAAISGTDRADSEEEQGLMDRAYRYFLELLNIREEKRSRRMQDQVYQDRLKE